MRIMPGSPLKEFARRFENSAVLAEAVFGSDNVVIGNHAAGDSLVEPHALLGFGLRNIAPPHRAGGPRASYIGRHFSLLDGIAHTALRSACPDWRVVSAAALIVALKPLAQFTEGDQIRGRANSAAEIGEVEIGRTLLLCNRIVEFPKEHRSLIEAIPVLDGS